ncbi:MAG: DNA-binding transcriptional LysR family regulator [Cognaticolwellia sp.]|jgi:DNA-binding transcriptional LysR family regulator
MLDPLHHLLLVAEHGSFTEAARRAHLSQPALSASIKKLEDALGAPLLHRLPRGAKPTAAGLVLLPHARAALGAVASGRQAVRALQGLERGQVRIAAGATACTYLLPDVLAEFHRRHPAITLRVRETWTPRINEAVRDGEVDLGITQGLPGDLPGVPWMLDKLSLVAAPSLASRLKKGHIQAGTPLITFALGAAMRSLSDRYLPQAEVIVELGSIAAVKGHVRAGLGVALLSHVAVATDLAMGRLVALESGQLPESRQLSVVHMGAERLPPAGLALLELLKIWPHLATQKTDTTRSI